MKSFIAMSALALAALAGQTSGAIIYDSNGFEAPTFTTGNIDAQDGWFTDPAAHTQHQVVGPTVVGSGTVNPAGGSQMVQLNQATATRWSFPDITAGVAARPVGQDWVINKFDVLVPASMTSTAVYGVLGYNTALSTLGGVRVRPSDRQLIVTLDPDGGGALTFTSYLTNVFLPADTWVNLGVAINVAGNGVAILSGETVLFSGTGPTATANATLSDFDFISGASTTPTNFVFADNYVVYSDSQAPAPGAGALLGLGGLVAARRRRA